MTRFLRAPAVYQHISVPAPEASELQIKVAYVALNPTDRMYSLFVSIFPTPPLIPFRIRCLFDAKFLGVQINMPPPYSPPPKSSAASFQAKSPLSGLRLLRLDRSRSGIAWRASCTGARARGRERLRKWWLQMPGCVSRFLTLLIWRLLVRWGWGGSARRRR